MLLQGRLTASSFCNAIGWDFGAGGGVKELRKLFREKVFGEKEHTEQQKQAMGHGVVSEETAKLAYQELTGLKVHDCAFALKGSDEVMSWLGASPDGLLDDPAGGALSVATGEGSFVHTHAPAALNRPFIAGASPMLSFLRLICCISFPV